MNGVQRVHTSIVANLRSFTRKPFTLGLLLLMPVVSIQLYGVSVGSMTDLDLFETTVPVTILGQVTGAVFATAALAGILGLFQSLSVRSADHRLVVAGYRPLELVAARFAVVLATALIVATVTTVSLRWVVSGGVTAPGVTVAGLFLAGVVYGLVGLLVGSVLPRELEGSLVLVALADVGALVASGLFGTHDVLTRVVPLSHPYEIVEQAVVDGTVAIEHALPALGQLVVVALLAVSAYSYGLPSRGDAS